MPLVRTALVRTALVRTAYVLFLIVAILLTPSRAAAQSLNLLADRFFPASLNDASVNLTLEGDFNHDGKADLITVTAGQNGSDTSYSILLGNGDGTFQAPTTIATGPTLGTILIQSGDFNGDGKLDFVALYYNNSFSVFLGNGDGTFQPAITTTILNPPQLEEGLAVGDFNHDGKSDVALTASAPQQNAGTVLVLISDGDGTFAAPVSYLVETPSWKVVVGDFNGDGKADLATMGPTPSVLLGNGDGTFQAARAINRGCGQTDALLVGDFNGDGLDDLALDQAILLSNGDGTFQPPLCNLITYPNVVADFNGDGIPDLISVFNEVYLGKGDGTFQSPLGFQASLFPIGSGQGNQFFSLAVADFSGDGKIDLAGSGLGNNVAVVLGNGNGTFNGLATASFSFNQQITFEPSALNIGDLRNDGNTDFVMFGLGGGFQEGEVFSLLGNGNGTFQAPIVTGSGSMTFGGILANLNNDGLPDAIALNYNQAIGVLLGEGNGQFSESFYDFAFQPMAVVAGDFNGDGKPDIVVPGQILLGNGDGTFGFPMPISVGGVPMLVGDINGDGKPDILQPGTGNAIAACLNNGNLSFNCIDTALAGVPVAFALADLNHDGKLDVAVGVGNPANSVQILLGNGDGTFQSKGTFTVPSMAYSIAVADLNGDGIPDLAFGGAGVSVLLGNGDGTFQTAVTYDGGGDVVAADFNGDGRIDLAALGGLSSISLLFNTVGLVPQAGANPSSLGFALQQVNTTSPAQKVTLQNSGGAALSISQIAISGVNSADFGRTNNCGSSLPANASCAISVTFTPTASGSRAATLSVTDALGVQNVALTGTGAPSIGLGIPPGGSNAATVTAGSAANYMLSIGGAGMSGTATLTCTGAPAGAICSLPSSENVSATQASPFAVTVSTTAQNSAAIQRNGSTLGFFWATMLVGLVYVPLGVRRRIVRALGTVLSLALILCITSCGGGSSSGNSGGNSGGNNSGGTPAGTYTLTVTATMGSTQQSQTLKLTVN